jgi:hypothetical protein
VRDLSQKGTMAKGAKGKYCPRHRNFEAIGYCEQCHSPYCGDCAVEALNHTFCSKECANSYGKFMSRYKPTKKPGFFSKLMNLVVTVLVLAVIGFAAYLFLTRSKAGTRLREKLPAIRTK